MQQHFNENYLKQKDIQRQSLGTKMVSSMFKISTFQSTYNIEGVLTIHGKSQQMRVPAYIKKSRQTVRISYQL
jgi:hypothetical protein